MTPLQSRLEKFEACDEATEWVGEKDLATAWAECPRGDWMLWFAARAGVDRKLLVMAACACARTALRFVPDGELRPLQAIEAAESWCRDEATIDQVQAAAHAAYYAASHAAYAAYADTAAAYAYYAYYAAAADAATAARTVARAECADLVRGIIKLDELADSIRAGGIS